MVGEPSKGRETYRRTHGHAAIHAPVARDEPVKREQNDLVTIVTDADSESSGSETQVSVLVGGLLVVVFGLAATLTAIGMGWIAAAALGAVLLLLAWKVRVPHGARVLSYIAAGFGVVALLGAAFDLVT